MMKPYTLLSILIFSAILATNSFGVTYDATVATDGSGDYTTVQAAFDAAPSNSTTRWVIYIKSGTYKEMLSLASGKNNITIIGESKTGTILTYDNYASKINPNTGSAYGTSGSASTYIYGSGFYAYNVTFRNSAGAVGQALAIYVRGDKAVFNNCRFVGNQDTYYGHNCRQYFVNCYFEGTTDFIFGSSIAWYESCQIYTKGGSAITAASTEPYVPYGYVFNNCTVTGSGSSITDLGRPWQPYASVAFINSSLSDAIKSEGWNDWGDSDNQETARFGEYNNTGAGSDMSGRPDWITRITASEAANYTILNVLKGTYANPQVIDNWNPQTVIDETNGSLTATLTKHGAGSSTQTVALGSAITSFYYTWENATSASATGLPDGVTYTLNSSAQTITISGTPTVTGAFPFTVTTVGASTNATKGGTITVTSSGTTLSYTKGTGADNNEVSTVKNEFAVYPNPVNTLINITGYLTENGNITVQVYTQSGCLVDSKTLGAFEKGSFKVCFPTNNINPGLYILKVQMGADIKNIPIVIYKNLK